MRLVRNNVENLFVSESIRKDENAMDVGESIEKRSFLLSSFVTYFGLRVNASVACDKIHSSHSTSRVDCDRTIGNGSVAK